MRMSTRVLLALPAGAALMASALAGPASAYGSAPKCTVTPGTAITGSTVSIVGVGFTAGSTVLVKGGGVAVVVSTSGKADSSGDVAVSGKAGNIGSGAFTLSSGSKSASCSVKVDPVAIVPTSVASTPAVQAVSLPNTGADGVGLELGIGASLVLGGVGALVMSARRRTA